jgi:hypothetical protein
MDGWMDGVGRNDKKEMMPTNKRNILCEVTAFYIRVLRNGVSVHKVHHK